MKGRTNIMTVMNLKTIKWESVKSIFGAIASAEQISRAQISEITGLSLVTVGKVADALLDMDMITQEKQIKVTAGRRAGLLAINKEKFVLILDLSSRVFRFSVLNLRLELLEKTPGSPHEAISSLPRRTVKGKRKSDESDDAIQLRLL